MAARSLILAFALALGALSGAEAQVYVRSGQLSQGWNCALGALVATLTQCQAVPTSATQRYYITNLSVQTTTTTAGTYQIRSGTGTNCATATTDVYPSLASVKFAAPISTSPMAYVPFVTPLAVAAGHAICVIGTATNTINIQLGGFVQ